MLVAHDATFRVVITCGLSMHGDPCSDDVVPARSLDGHLTVQSVIHGKVSGYDSGIRVKQRTTLIDPERNLLGDGKLCPCAECERS
jgi:hypothetical protein